MAAIGPSLPSRRPQSSPAPLQQATSSAPVLRQAQRLGERPGTPVGCGPLHPSVQPMLLGSADLQVAMARQQAGWHDVSMQNHQGHCEEHTAWRQQEAAYLQQLEAHYHREQEAEFNASLQEYYAARARHQAEQQRLNQVLYGPYAHPPPHHSMQQHAAPPHPQHPQQQQQDAPMGMDCGGWQAAASPRAPLAAVNGWQLSGGMQWEAAVGGASRKRGHEAAIGDHPSGGPDTAFKRRAFRHDVS